MVDWETMAMSMANIQDAEDWNNPLRRLEALENHVVEVKPFQLVQLLAGFSLMPKLSAPSSPSSSSGGEARHEAEKREQSMREALYLRVTALIEHINGERWTWSDQAAALQLLNGIGRCMDPRRQSPETRRTLLQRAYQLYDVFEQRRKDLLHPSNNKQGAPLLASLSPALNALLYCCCRAGDHQRALALYERLKAEHRKADSKDVEEKRQLINTRTLDTVVLALLSQIEVPRGRHGDALMAPSFLLPTATLALPRTNDGVVERKKDDRRAYNEKIIEQLLSILRNDSKEFGVELDRNLYNQALTLFLHVEAWPQFTQLFEELQRKEEEESRNWNLQRRSYAGDRARTYSMALEVYSKIGGLEKVKGLFKQMKKKQVPLTRQIYAKMVEAHGHAGDLAGALQYFHETKQQGYDPTKAAYSSLIQTYCRHILALERQDRPGDSLYYWTYVGTPKIRNMEQNNILQLTSSTSGIDAEEDDEGENEDFEGDDEGDEQRENRGVKGEIRAKADLYAAHVVQLLEEMEQLRKTDENMRLSLPAYKSVIDMFCFRGETSKAQHYYDQLLRSEHSPHLRPADKVWVLNRLIKSHAMFGRISEALQVLQAIKSSGLKPTEDTANTLLRAFVRAERLEEAMSTLKDMKELGFVPFPQTYRLLMSGWEQRANGKAVIKELLQELEGHFLTSKTKRMGMLKERRAPHVVVAELATHSKGVTSSPASGSSSAAYLRNLQEKEVANFGAWAAAMLYGYIRTNDWDAALRMIAHFEEADIVPPVRVWNGVLQLCIRQPRPDMQIAAQIAEKIRRSIGGTTPETYNLLLQGHVENGNLKEATRLYSTMINNGIEPTTRTHDLLMHGFNQHGQFDAMLNLFKELQTQNLTARKAASGTTGLDKRILLGPKGVMSLIASCRDGRALRKVWEVFVELDSNDRLRLGKSGVYDQFLLSCPNTSKKLGEQIRAQMQLDGVGPKEETDAVLDKKQNRLVSPLLAS
ncbi:hypothetical protein QOT17_001673 [Balamuthia mandrillaris]